MSNTMLQFKETISEINKIKNQEKLIAENFEKSTCELSECFHWILKAALDGRNSCYLKIETCPELYAKTLNNMGFEIEKNRNDFNTLCEYDIKWNCI